jgi:hypothetical protein
MSARLIIGIVALACVSASGLISSLLMFEIIDKVNEQLPKENRFARSVGMGRSTRGSAANTRGCIRMEIFSGEFVPSPC